MTDKKQIQLVKTLIKQIKKEYNPHRKEVCIGCGACQAKRLIEYLKWHLELLIWDDKINK